MLGTLSYHITATTQPLNQKLGEARQSMQSTDKAMSTTSKNINTSSKQMSTTAGGNVGQLTGAIGGVSPAAGQAVGGFQKMSMAARAFQAALGPIGLALAALGVAIAAVTKYFTGSVEGQQKMAKIMGYLQGITTYLTDAMIALGGWIVKAFEDPQQAVKDLWEVIKNYFINRFQGMIGMVQAGWEVIQKGARGAMLAIKGIFDKDARQESKQYFIEAGEAMVEFGKQALKAATGIDDITGKIGKMGRQASGVANEMAKLAERESNLRLQQIDDMTTIARLDAEIATARRIANDDQEDLNKQIAAQEKGMELVAQKFAIQEKRAKEALAIQQERMALGQNNIQDLEKEAELEAKLIGLQQSRENETRSLLRRYTTLLNAKEAEGKATLAAIEKERQARAEVLEDIRKAGLTEAEVLQEAMEAKLEAHEWTEAERLKITEHYQEQINAIYQQEVEAARQAKEDILDNIRQSGLTEIELMQERMDAILEAHNWTEEERYKISEYWTGKMSALEQGRTEEIAQAYTNMTQMIGGAMSGLFAEMGKGFAGAETDFRSYVGSMLDGIGQIINGLLAKAIAGMISGEASKGIVGLAIGAIGVGALKSLWASQVPKMAKGGVIPPGYPNDTYPALLTSGETVIPPKKLQTQSAGPMVARIENAGPDLLIYLDQQRNRMGGSF